MCFFLSCLREVADAFEVTDDAGEVVDIVAVTVGTFLQVAFVDMSAIVADGIRDVERKIVAAFACSDAKELAVLFLAEVFFQIAVQRRAAGEVFDVLLTVQAEFVEDVGVGVFDDVKIAVVAVAVYLVAVFLVPFGMFHAYVLGGDHLAIEHEAVFLRVIFLVVFLDEAEHVLHEMLIIWVVADRDLKELGGFDQAVDADGEVLPSEVDVACIEQR